MAHELAVCELLVDYVNGNVNWQFCCLAQINGFEPAVYVVPCEHYVVPFFAGHFAQYAVAGVYFALFDVVANKYVFGRSVFASVFAF